MATQTSSLKGVEHATFLLLEQARHFEQTVEKHPEIKAALYGAVIGLGLYGIVGAVSVGVLSATATYISSLAFRHLPRSHFSPAQSLALRAVVVTVTRCALSPFALSLWIALPINLAAWYVSGRVCSPDGKDIVICV